MKDRLNLLPREFQEAMSSARRARRWMIAIVLVGLVGLGAISKQRQAVSELEEQHQKQAPEVEAIRLLQAKSSAARAKLHELRTKHALSSMLENELPVVQILGVFSQSAFDPERRIELSDLRADEILRNLPAAPAAKRPGNNRNAPKIEQEKVLAVIVKGVAQDDMIVARFVGNLKESKMFQSVKLNSTSGDQQQAGSGREFEIECVY